MLGGWRTRSGIPVVTLVTDLPTTSRAAYVGLDNRAAGATAAYLLAQWLADRPGDILVVRGRGSFRGEDDREVGFRGTLRDSRPARAQVDVIDDEDQADAVSVSVHAALAAHPAIRAVYSMYAGAGGNTAVLDAFAALGQPCDAFIAHDLDGENGPLLQQRRLSAVLQHDLRHDLRRACQVIMPAQHALPGPIVARPSSVQVITPYNVPPCSSRPTNPRPSAPPSLSLPPSRGTMSVMHHYAPSGGSSGQCRSSRRAETSRYRPTGTRWTPWNAPLSWSWRIC